MTRAATTLRARERKEIALFTILLLLAIVIFLCIAFGPFKAAYALQ